MSFQTSVLRTVAVLVILGTCGNALTNVTQANIQAVPMPINSDQVALQLQEDSRGLGSIFRKPNKKKNRYRTEGQVDVDVPFPNPSYTFHHVLDYWPYNKIYTTNLFTVIDFTYWLLQAGKRFIIYLYDLMFLGLRISFQIFEILEMRKSFDTLSDTHGPGWGDDDRGSRTF